MAHLGISTERVQAPACPVPPEVLSPASHEILPLARGSLIPTYLSPFFLPRPLMRLLAHATTMCSSAYTTRCIHLHKTPQCIDLQMPPWCVYLHILPWCIHHHRPPWCVHLHVPPRCMQCCVLHSVHALLTVHAVHHQLLCAATQFIFLPLPEPVAS